ncbi:YdcH family protein [Belnapia moabensis]|uniref:YdcH family protein n=1 Tax=Belnapia moabensis TaxID=365533 RepID=UPI00316AC495
MLRRRRNSGRQAAEASDASQDGKGDVRMMTSPRLRSLEDKHAILERAIGAQDARPRPDELELARLKREKLRLKEEIEKLRRAG